MNMTEQHELNDWRKRNPGLINIPGAVSMAVSNYGYDYVEYQSRYDTSMRGLRDATQHGLMPQPDLPMLRKGLEWVEWNAERGGEHQPGETYWDQGTWRAVYPAWVDNYFESKDCNTALCFAGYTADSAGVEWLDPRGEDDSVVPLTPKLVATHPEVVAKLRDGGCVRSDSETGIGLDTVGVSDFARTLLGLDIQEASLLFAGNNDVESIRRVIAVIHERAGERL